MAFRETSIELKQNDHILYSWRDIKFVIQIELMVLNGGIKEVILK